MTITRNPTRSQKSQNWGGRYKLGDHILVCGDSTDGSVVAKACPEPADLLITDPPYNLDYEGKTKARLKIENDNMQDDEFLDFLVSSFSAAKPHIKNGGVFYIWYASTQSKAFLSAAEKAGLEVRQLLVWVKNIFALGRQDYQWRHEPCLYGWKEGAAHYFIDDRTQTTVFEDTRPDLEKMKKEEMKELLERIFDEGINTTVLREKKPAASQLHPTMKPVPLIGRLIKNSSKPGQIVLDTFGGSGTTMIACEQLGRKCRMVELDPHYANVIIDRWEKFTGGKAEEIDGN